MSTKGRDGANVKILHPYDARREPHAELTDVALLDDAARRIARSGHALNLYYSQLDSLREAAKDVGNTVLAERSSRAELHTRLILSAGLDALNELHDLGVLQQSLRGAIAEPATVNRTTLAEVIDHCSETLKHRYPEESWKWFSESKRMFSDVTVQVEPDGRVLRATVMLGDRPITLALTPEGGKRIDTGAFFGSADGNGSVRAAESILKLSPALSTGGESVRSAYDCAIDGLAFARESVYRHARNAVELGAPARSGAGPGVIVIIIMVAATVSYVVGAIESYVCKTDHDTAACKWAAILGIVGTVLMGAAEATDKNSDPNTGTARTRLQFGTNR